MVTYCLPFSDDAKMGRGVKCECEVVLCVGHVLSLNGGFMEH